MFGFYRGVHVLQPKAYIENNTILGPKVLFEVVDDNRIALPASHQEVNYPLLYFVGMLSTITL